jgi:hypothetical protein
MTDRLYRALPPLLMVLLVAAWLLGGAPIDASPADEALMLFALPVLAAAALALVLEGVPDRLQRWALIALAAVVAVPALQLLPLPAAWTGTGRAALAGDLAVAGVAVPARWSLAPGATEAGLWALLPAVAAFLAALTLDGQGRRLLVKTVLLLVGANVLVAFFQAGLPPDSPLRLYDSAGFGGLLVNTNHQGTALVIALALASGQAVHAWRRAAAGRARPQAWVGYAAIAVACLLLVPLSTSRAAMVLALPTVAAALLLCGGLPWHALRRNRRAIAGVAVLVAVAAVGVHAALGWMAVDQAEELRHTLAGATLDAARGYAPWGTGIGSFVPVFAANAPPALWLPQYVNHAHNEYAQWWLTAGVPGLLALALVLAVLAVATARVLRARGRDGHAILAASCLVAIAAVLAHSAADYPLRTLTLMTTAAALAGAMLGALADTRSSVPADHPPA